jgi:hypothetical protein
MAKVPINPPPLRIRLLAMVVVTTAMPLRGENIPYQPMQLRSLMTVYASAHARVRSEEGFQEGAIFQIDEQQLKRADTVFDALVLGNEPDPPRRRLDLLLRSKIEAINAICELTSTQYDKLDLAGRGDIKRFFDRVEKLRDNFRDSGTTGIVTQDMAHETGLLQLLVRDGQFFGEGSLFAKTMRRSLTAEQFERIADSQGANHRQLRQQPEGAKAVK